MPTPAKSRKSPTKVPTSGCLACLADRRALAAWQAEGGMLPAPACLDGHLVKCRGCKGWGVTVNEDGRCDTCWLAREHKERPLIVVALTEEERATLAIETERASAERLALARMEFEAVTGVSVQR